jgi:NO-binding membrane sensor protein with MHYT domain
MPTVHQFAYGALNPIAGYLLALVGSFIGLAAAAQARATNDGGRRFRWLVIASVAIGTGIWLMHFMAMLGFDVPEAPVRYDPLVTAFSALMAILVVGVGIFIAGYGRRSGVRVLAGGLFTGSGVAAMHYTGMAAMRLPGSIGYDISLVAASVLVAVIAATVALWFTVTVDGWWPRLFAAVVMGVAVTGMHYTGMGAVHVQLRSDAGPVGGINPILLVLPITVIAAGALIGLVFTALQASSQEDFAAVEPAQVRLPESVAGTVHVGQIMAPPAVRRSGYWSG